MASDRPKRRPQPRRFDLVLNVLTVLSLIAGIVLVLWYWPQLPAQVPIHFNAAGEADGWGAKGMIWLLPGISLVLVPGILALQRFPWLGNVPVTINESNAEYQYSLVVRLLAILGFFIAVDFLLILIETIAIALGGKGPLGGWILPVLIVPTIGSILWYLLAMVRQPGEPASADGSDGDQLSSKA